jgi:hypothetical protein
MRTGSVEMSFVQVRDALAAIRAHYSQLATTVSALTGSDPRIGDTARRILEAETRTIEAVSSLEDTASESTLTTWLQFFPEEHLVRLHNDHHKLNSVEELFDYYRTFNQALVELFDLVARSTECQATREIFDLLRVVEQQNARDLGWAVRDTA